MVFTKNNIEAASKIARILAEKKCTVADMPGILSYVQMKITNHTSVQQADFSSELKECEQE